MFPAWMSCPTHLWGTFQEKESDRMVTVDLLQVLFVAEDEDGGSTLHMGGNYVIGVRHSRARVVELMAKGASAP
jgi:hypothetical protein